MTDDRTADSAPERALAVTSSASHGGAVAIGAQVGFYDRYGNGWCEGVVLRRNKDRTKAWVEYATPINTSEWVGDELHIKPGTWIIKDWIETPQLSVIVDATQIHPARQGGQP